MNAEKSSHKWHVKYKGQTKEMKELREMNLLYEGLINKLTEQNNKLKAMVKSKKRSRKASLRDARSYVSKHERSIFDMNILTTGENQSGSKSARSGALSARSRVDQSRSATMANVHNKRDSKDNS